MLLIEAPRDFAILANMIAHLPRKNPYSVKK
jgi:hypothetical protein